MQKILSFLYIPQCCFMCCCCLPGSYATTTTLSPSLHGCAWATYVYVLCDKHTIKCNIIETKQFSSKLIKIYLNIFVLVRFHIHCSDKVYFEMNIWRRDQQGRHFCYTHLMNKWFKFPFPPPPLAAAKVKQFKVIFIHVLAILSFYHYHACHRCQRSAFKNFSNIKITTVYFYFSSHKVLYVEQKKQSKRKEHG